MSEGFMRLTERYAQCFTGDLDAIDDTCAADYLYHESPLPDTVGVQAHREQTAGLRQAFPDLEMTVDDIFSSGDRQVLRWTLTGTHSGQLPTLPIPPTGKKVTMSGIAVDRIVDGKFVETWNYVDLLGLLQQLGVAPAVR